MALTIDATVGGASANSYETAAEAQNYFDARLALSGWTNADTNGKNVLLAMATRTLNALAQPFKTLIPPQGGAPAYFRIRRQWTGIPATPGQKLAWPRMGMFDANGNPLDIAIVGNTVASPTVLSTGTVPHRLKTGDTVLVFNDTSSVPAINGPQVVTVIGTYSFSIPIAVTVAGTGARFATVPQELKDAQSELAGQLGTEDRTLDNSVVTQGLTSVKAGSVALTFKENIVPQVIPDAVYNLMPQSWLTDELYILADSASFEVASADPTEQSWYRRTEW